MRRLFADDGLRGSALLILLLLFHQPFLQLLGQYRIRIRSLDRMQTKRAQKTLFPSLILRIENIMRLLPFVQNTKVSITVVKGRLYTTNDIALPAIGEMHGKSIKIKADPSVLF